MESEQGSYKYELLTTRLEKSTLLVKFNRPEVRNAINWEMEQELYDALRTAQDDDSVKAVVLMGEGQMFSAGHDLKAVAADRLRDDPPQNEGVYWARNPRLLPSWHFDKPLIGAVHGFAGPYATGILLTCDFRIAAEGARFSFEHARMSTGGVFGQYATLLYHFPMSVVKQLWLVGGWMDADAAHQLHFVQRVVPESDLEQTALHWSEQISLVETASFRSKKKGLHAQYEALNLDELTGLTWDPPALPGGRPTSDLFYKVLAERGLRAALDVRDVAMSNSVAQIR